MTAKKKRAKIWVTREDGRDLRVSGEWAGGPGPEAFSEAELQRAFKRVKEALEAEFPGAVVNPWKDAPAGTLNGL